MRLVGTAALLAVGVLCIPTAHAAEENGASNAAGQFESPDGTDTVRSNKDATPESASVDTVPAASMEVSDPAVPAPEATAPQADASAPATDGTTAVATDAEKPASTSDSTKASEQPTITTEFNGKSCKREDPDEEEIDYFYIAPPEVPGFKGWKTNKVPRGRENDELIPVPDRWRVGLAPDTRHPKGNILNPYRQNILKGDYPIIGQSLFLVASATSDSLVEGHRLPTPSGVTSQRFGSEQFFGRGEQLLGNENIILSLEFFKGETDFKPREWEIRITPVFNVNYVQTEENFATNIDPREGSNRLDSHIAFQELFGEYHLHDISKNYDFVSSRFGIQEYDEDFRGFLFLDNNLGAHFFGNLESNRLQYNLVYFEQLEKDTNSGLNTFNLRHQHVLLGNVIRQDTLIPGYDMIFNVAFNDDEATLHYNTNGVITRPAPIGDLSQHSVKAGYAGFGGNGHIGKLNISNQFYQAFGEDSHNPLASRKQDINAQMFALETSYDKDWMTFRASFFYASGDKNPTDKTARGFDTIMDDPNFAGGEFSFWVRNGIEGGNALTSLKNRFSLVPNLRTDKAEGQSNFVNPGVQLYNVGYDAELTPTLTAKLNFNYLRFDQTAPVEALLHQGSIDRELGYDYSLGMVYRPWLNNQVIITGGVSGFTPVHDGGFAKVYTNQTLFAGFLNLIVRY
jgi:hypothetical protein